MKTTLSLCLALFAVASAQAQIFRSEAVNGAVLGGIAGGIIGHNSGSGNGWKGAAIGSAAGLILGQAVGDARADRDYVRGGGYIYRSEPRVSVGIGVGYGHYHGGYGHGYHGRYRGYRPYHGYSWGVSYSPSYRYYYDSPSYVYRTEPAPVIVQQPQVVQAPAQPVQQAAPQQVTIINNYYNTPSPMSSANSLFGR